MCFLVGSGTVHPGSDLSFLGRSSELAALRRAAAATRTGKPDVVFVSGVAGIGKTSLLNRAREELEGHGGTVLFATGGSSDETLRELFAPLGLTAPEEARRPLLSGAARGAAPTLLPGSEAAPAEGVSYSILHGWYRLALNLLAQGPLTLMLDDAHRCDPLVLRWVDFLLRRADDHALLVVLADEPDAAGPGRELLATITGHTAGTMIELTPLSDAEVGDSAAAALGAGPEAAFVQICSKLSGGNPLSLHTLLKALREQGVRPDEPGARQAAEIGERVLRDSIRARLARLPESALKVAAGIVLLDTAEPRMVAALLELPAPAVVAAIDVLRRHRLLPSVGSGIVREQAQKALLGQLPRGELDALRLRGALLLHDNGRPPEKVARLLAELPELSEPWMYNTLREAAADARRRDDPEAATRFLNRYLRAVPGHQETLVELATILEEIDPETAFFNFFQAIRRTDDLRARVPLVIRLSLLSLRVGRSVLAFRLLADVLEALGANAGVVPDAASDLRLQVRTLLLAVGMHSQRTAREALRRARTIEARSNGTPSERMLLSLLGSTAVLDGGHWEQAAKLARAALSGTLVVHAGPLIIAAQTLNYAGLPAEALAALDPIVEGIEGPDARWTLCHALAVRSWVAAGMGRPVEAADIETAMRMARHEDWALPRIMFASHLVNRGEPARAEALLDEIRQPNFAWEYPQMLMVRAWARLQLDDFGGALSILQQCGHSLAEAGINCAVPASWWFEATALLTGLDRRSEALALIDAQEEAIVRWGTPEVVGLGLAARGVATGGRAGLELMAEGVERLAASPARHSQLRAELVVGHALVLAGNDVEARKYLRRATDLAARCGCQGVGALAKKWLVAAGGRTRKPGGGPFDLFTAAEWRVIEQAVAGATNREIAAALFVTLRTVETHLSNVYRKVGVSSRAEMIAAVSELSEAKEGIGPGAAPTVSAETFEGEGELGHGGQQ